MYKKENMLINYLEELFEEPEAMAYLRRDIEIKIKMHIENGYRHKLEQKLRDCENPRP